LQGIQAALTDTDGSETLQLTLAGLPVGSSLSDGVHSATITSTQPVADITGWNTYALALTPPANYSGILNLQATATATESANGSKASVTQAISVQIDAVAQVPTLTLTPSSVNLSRSVVDTSWEGVCDFDYGATIIYDSQFAGWNMLPARSGKVSVFQIWGNNDQMTNAAGKKVSVQAASGAGQEWLGLTNGVNSGSSSLYQSPGIEQSINTIDGAQYTFNLDYLRQLLGKPRGELARGNGVRTFDRRQRRHGNGRQKADGVDGHCEPPRSSAFKAMVLAAFIATTFAS
jgi:hypothetical protein